MPTTIWNGDDINVQTCHSKSQEAVEWKGFKLEDFTALEQWADWEIKSDKDAYSVYIDGALATKWTRDENEAYAVPDVEIFAPVYWFNSPGNGAVKEIQLCQIDV